METVHTLGRSVDVIILTTIMAVDGEAVFKVVAHLGLAQRNETIAAGEGVDIHFILVAVCTIYDLLPYLGPLPLKPIRNVGELGFTFSCGELTIFFHKPALAAVFAEDFRAFCGHLELSMTMGALVEYFL